MMDSPTEQLFIFVVHGHDDEQFRLASGFIHGRSERIPFGFEIVWIAGGSGISRIVVLAVYNYTGY